MAKHVGEVDTDVARYAAGGGQRRGGGGHTCWIGRYSDVERIVVDEPDEFERHRLDRRSTRIPQSTREGDG
eukprot:6476590-Amphidinium_carterae.2